MLTDWQMETTNSIENDHQNTSIQWRKNILQTAKYDMPNSNYISQNLIILLYYRKQTKSTDVNSTGM